MCSAPMKANCLRLCHTQIELCEALDDIMDVSQAKSWNLGIQAIDGLFVNHLFKNFRSNNKGLITMQKNQKTYGDGSTHAQPPIATSAWKGLLRTCKMSK